MTATERATAPSGPSGIPLEAIRAARERIAGFVVRTPLLRLNLSPDEAPAEIYLKLENLQPIGSFKLRGVGNAIALARPEQLERGVITASAGNMAQGVAWAARRLGIPCTVIVPDHAPETKLAAISRLGGAIVKISFDDWWQVVVSHQYELHLPAEAQGGLFIHPVSEPAVMAGNGTIGLEVIVPYGGGGLSAGIASAIRALKPETKVYAAEVDTAAPLAPSLAAGSPQEVLYKPTFVDGIGGKSLLPEMWPLAASLLSGSLAVSPEQVAAAIRLLVERNRVVAEGAGATPVAAALAGMAGVGRVVCIVSGGNIDSHKLATILEGSLP